MDKLNMQTTNIVDENIKRIGVLFPNCLTEAKDDNGQLKTVIDFEKLKQELSEDAIGEGQERYEFTWPDKRHARRLANTPITDTLRPIPEDETKPTGKDTSGNSYCSTGSVDFDKTQNLYIEGDNLQVLKLLRENYLGKVKMIYIDPPYNTGGDFVYKDNFIRKNSDYAEISGSYDDDGNQIVDDWEKNAESNGRFHTDWLNMIYPRIKVAKDLLSEDGLFFVQIDDNEIDNLKKTCIEIFGPSNFVNVVSIKTKVGGVSGSSEGKSLKDSTEFILIFAKNKNYLQLNPVYIKTKLFDRIKDYQQKGKSWKYTSVVAELCDKVLLKYDEKHNMSFYGYKTLRTESIQTFAKEKGITEEDVYNQYADRIFQTTNAQSSVRQTVIKETSDFNYPMFGLEYEPIKGKNEGNKIEILYKGEQRRMMMFLSDTVEKIDNEYYYLDKLTTLWDDIDYNNLTKEGDIEFPNGKKPIKLIQRIINLATSKDSIILDFFSGSASTAHAVIQANLEDNGNRKYIMVQLPEETDEKSEAYKAGYKNICEIGKERIRRAGKKIKEEHPEAKDLDIGFRVLKLDSSNMQDVYYTPAETTEQSFYDDNIKGDRTDEDLLFQSMIDLGISLSAKIDKKQIAGKTVWSVEDNYLLACFDENVNETTITEIAKQQPYYFIMRDSSLANDNVADNFEQIFNHYSKDTIRRIL